MPEQTEKQKIGKATKHPLVRVSDSDSEDVLALFYGELDLVEILARKLSEKVDGQWEELVSIGQEALLLSARRYEPGAASFRTYASHRVFGAMLDWVRTCHRIPAGVVRGMAARGVDIGALWDNYAEVATDNISPEEAMIIAQLKVALHAAIDKLPKRQRELMRRHYINGELFEFIAADIGLSKSWASRIHTRALARLAKLVPGELR